MSPDEEATPQEFSPSTPASDTAIARAQAAQEALAKLHALRETDEKMEAGYRGSLDESVVAAFIIVLTVLANSSFKDALRADAHWEAACPKVTEKNIFLLAAKLTFGAKKPADTTDEKVVKLAAKKNKLASKKGRAMLQMHNEGATAENALQLLQERGIEKLAHQAGEPAREKKKAKITSSGRVESRKKDFEAELKTVPASIRKFLEGFQLEEDVPVILRVSNMGTKLIYKPLTLDIRLAHGDGDSNAPVEAEPATVDQGPQADDMSSAAMPPSAVEEPPEGRPDAPRYGAGELSEADIDQAAA